MVRTVKNTGKPMDPAHAENAGMTPSNLFPDPVPDTLVSRGAMS